MERLIFQVFYGKIYVSCGGILCKLYYLLFLVLVLLQSNREESGAQIISGGNSDLFSNRKERGSELVISRITLVLGMAFFLISFVMEFI